MKNEIPDFSCVESMLREYGKDHGVGPEQVMDIFHEGIVAVAEKYSEDDPLRVAVMRGTRNIVEPNVPSNRLPRSGAVV